MHRRQPPALAIPILALSFALPLHAAAPRQVEPERVDRWRSPVVDVQQLLAEDALADGSRPVRLGHPWKTDLHPAAHGRWSDLPGKGQRWELEVHSDDALWVVLGFGTFRIPDGASLTVSSPAGRQSLGPYTSADVRPHGQLWIPPIEGETALVTLSWPEALRGTEPRLHLGTVSHGYRKWLGIGKTREELTRLEESPDETPEVTPNGSGFCNIDVNCPEGTGWEDQSRSVVGLLIGGSGFCTGALINNTSNDCTPYVATAEHCDIGGTRPAASVLFRFNYQRPDCASGSPETGHVLAGSSIVATYAPSDFQLLLMDDDPLEEFDAYFTGWNRTTSAPQSAVGIHHPSCDVKKISLNDDVLINGIWYGSNHWRVTEWEDGTTEGCSSGSPLFDQNQLFVGQLHGGEASCFNNSWDEYGKFSTSWETGTTANARAKDWLDPTGTGAFSLAGLDHQICLTPQPELVYASHAIDDSAGNSNGAVDPGESIQLDLTLTNEGNLNASNVSARISSQTSGVTAGRASIVYPNLNSGADGSGNGTFSIQVAESVGCGDPIMLQVTASADEEPTSWVSNFAVQTGTANSVVAIADDIEGGAGNWTSQTFAGSNPFQLSSVESQSPTTSWFVANINSISDSVIELAEVTDLAPGSELSFWHWIRSEAGFDGGVLEYNVNSTGWADAELLFIEGGYNSPLATNFGSPLAGRSAWTGDPGEFLRARLDLSGFVGDNIRFRWRFATDQSVGSIGWYVDDVLIDQTTIYCEPPFPLPPGEASFPGAPDSAFTIGKDAGGYTLAWSAPINGGPVDDYVLYSMPLGGTSTACEGALGTEKSAIVSNLPTGHGFLIVARNEVGEGGYGDASDGTPRSPADPLCAP